MSLLKVNQVKKSQRGISLFDFVLWFAIAGAFLAAIYAIFAPGRAQVRAQDLFIEIQSSQSAIRNYYAGNPNFYQDLTLSGLVKNKVLPSSIKASGENGFSTEGGGVTIAVAKDSGKDITANFVITYSAMPTTAANMLIGKLNLDDWVSVMGGADGKVDCKANFVGCTTVDPTANATSKIILQSS